MNDIEIMAQNPHIHPALSFWGWEIAVYLFLGGLTAGLMILTGLAWRRKEGPPHSLAFWGPMLAPVALSAGMFALFLDLEAKLHVFRFYTTFQWKAPMSWGSWILVLVFPAMLLMAWAAWTESKSASPDSDPFPMRRFIAGLNIVGGIALGIYTGLLLGNLGARPLWNTPLLGPLFLASGLSSAAALLSLFEKDEAARHRLAKLDAKFILSEALILGLVLLAMAAGGAAQRSSAQLLMGGPYTAVFWVPVVFMGMVLPLALERWSRQGRAMATQWPAILVLIGGAALRAVVVFAGQASRWEVL